MALAKEKVRLRDRFPSSPLSIILRKPQSLFMYIQARRALRVCLGIPAKNLREWQEDLLANARLPSLIRSRWEKIHGTGLETYSGGATIGPQNEFLYYVVRHRHPELVVETGVASGFSTSYILQGLHDNDFGRLVSIDLPTTNPDGYVNCDGKRDQVHVTSKGSVGEVVPDSLRSRWELRISDARTALPSLLDRNEQVSLFWHDSDHSYSHVKWELETVWPHVAPTGVVLVDDISWSRAFTDFCDSVNCRHFAFYGRGGALKVL